MYIYIYTLVCMYMCVLRYVCMYIYIYVYMIYTYLFVILGRKTQRCTEMVDFRSNLFTSSDHVPNGYLTWFVNGSV